jgi:hypothetical protein
MDSSIQILQYWQNSATLQEPPRVTGDPHSGIHNRPVMPRRKYSPWGCLSISPMPTHPQHRALCQISTYNYRWRQRRHDVTRRPSVVHRHGYGCAQPWCVARQAGSIPRRATCVFDPLAGLQLKAYRTAFLSGVCLLCNFLTRDHCRLAEIEMGAHSSAESVSGPLLCTAVVFLARDMLRASTLHCAVPSAARPRARVGYGNLPDSDV